MINLNEGHIKYVFSQSNFFLLMFNFWIVAYFRALVQSKPKNVLFFLLKFRTGLYKAEGELNLRSIDAVLGERSSLAQ